MKQTLPRIWNKWKGFLLLKLFHVIEDRHAPKLQGEGKHTKTLICVIHLFSIPWMNKANTQGWQTRALYPPEIFKKKIGKDKKKRTKKKRTKQTKNNNKTQRLLKLKLKWQNCYSVSVHWLIEQEWDLGPTTKYLISKGNSGTLTNVMPHILVTLKDDVGWKLCILHPELNKQTKKNQQNKKKIKQQGEVYCFQQCNSWHCIMHEIPQGWGLALDLQLVQTSRNVLISVELQHLTPTKDKVY